MRKVDLHRWTDYDTIGKALEFDTRVQAENPEFQLYAEALEAARFRRYILYADERGIRRWEQMLELSPWGSLEDRRQRVYIKWNEMAIITDRSLRQMLDIMLRKDAYTLTLRYHDYGLEVHMDLDTVPVTVNQLYAWLRATVPANLTLKVTVGVGSTLVFTTAFTVHRHRLYKCGEIPAGVKPYVMHRAEVAETVAEACTGEYVAKDYIRKVGEHKARRNL